MPSRPRTCSWAIWTTNTRVGRLSTRQVSWTMRLTSAILLRCRPSRHLLISTPPFSSSSTSQSRAATLSTSRSPCSSLSSRYSRPSLSSLCSPRAICRSLPSCRKRSVLKSKILPVKPTPTLSRCRTSRKRVSKMSSKKHVTSFLTTA